MVEASKRRQGFTLVELLVVIAIIGILAALVVPNLMRGQSEALKMQCKTNLKAIHMAAYNYSLKSYAFPLAKGKEPPAHESLNVLLASTHGEGLEPETFVCPEGEASEAEVIDDKFVLDDNTNSYAWVAKRTKSTASKAPLASDKYAEDPKNEIQYSDGEQHAGHLGVLNLVYTHGAVADLDLYEDADELSDDYLPKGLVR